MSDLKIAGILNPICLISALIVLAGCGGGGGGSAGGSSSGGGSTPVFGGNATGGDRNPVCAAGTSTGEVARPQFRMNLQGQTSWYASPVVADLNGDGQHQLIAAYYSLYVFGSDGTLLDRADGGSGRIYAPHVVVDLEGDGIPEIVYGNGSEVYAYEWRSGGLEPEGGMAGGHHHGRRVPGSPRAGRGRPRRRRPDRDRGHDHPDRRAPSPAARRCSSSPATAPSSNPPG